MANQNVSTTAVDTANVPNPHFQNIDRPAYEIGHILPMLPSEHWSFLASSDEEFLLIEALGKHTSNALYTVLSGMESLGNVIFAAANSDNNSVSQNDLSNIGCLIAHLAVEAQFLSETEYDCSDVLRKRELNAATAKKGAKK